jgi:hypothetical protein
MAQEFPDNRTLHANTIMTIKEEEVGAKGVKPEATIPFGRRKRK